VQMAVEGHRLTITVDLAKEFGPSASTVQCLRPRPASRAPQVYWTLDHGS